jgi:HAD superfamily hydrolase (TIGR01509 family)
MTTTLLFDVDGTLLDSVDLHARCWQKALGQFGYMVELDEVRRQIGKGGDLLMVSMLGEDEVRRSGAEISAYRADVFKREFLPKVQAYPKVRELFENLDEDGKRLVLASSAKSDELEVYKKIADVADLIEAETSADDADRSKPYPDIFQVALRKVDAKPQEALVIGDTIYDAQAAGKAGIRCVGVATGVFTEQELQEAGCIAVFRDVSDLLERYEELQTLLRTP